MSDSLGQVTDASARQYEAFFVPALFGQWPPRIVDATQIAARGHALDVACGTGIVAREMARRIGAAQVQGLDRNPGMLEVARQADPGIGFHEGRAESLPFDDASFDAITCAFGLMFFEDRAAALREMWRVLKPDGRIVVSVWAGLAHSPGYATMVGLLQDLFGDAVADELRAPFCLGEPRLLTEAFGDAEIPAEVATWAGKARFASLEDWVHTDVKAWTLADRLDEVEYERLRHAATSALAPFVVDGTRVEFDAPALLAVAMKPSMA